MSEQNEQKHTKLPWVVDENAVDSDPNNGYTHHRVALCLASDSCGDMCYANAEFIVTACNSHYDLLEALEELWESGNNTTYAFTKDGGKALEKARAAIQKATG